MPTDSSYYLSIRKPEVFLNLTGVVPRRLTFDSHSVFREHLGIMADGDVERPFLRPLEKSKKVFLSWKPK